MPGPRLDNIGEWVRRMGEASAKPIGNLLSIQTDCRDPERLAAFWGWFWASGVFASIAAL